MSKVSGSYKRVLHFYETDAMGIIHHANYLRLMEEARVSFLRQIPGGMTGLLQAINYPLIRSEVDYHKPLRFNQETEIHYQAWAEGVRLYFDYQFRLKDFANPVAFGKTVHVAFNTQSQRAVRLPKALLDHLQSGR
jgi:acyl-CoA thioester hydrolase